MNNTSNDWIETGTGQRFEILNPTPDMIKIEDIANALSKQCRYNGHCLKFYSVAEHSVILSEWAEERDYPIEDVKALLLHDAAEAYTGDCPTPLKKLLPKFREIEDIIEKVVGEKYGVELPLRPDLKMLDARIIVDERAQNLVDSGNVWAVDRLDALGVSITGLPPETAKVLFMNRYRRLFNV